MIQFINLVIKNQLKKHTSYRLLTKLDLTSLNLMQIKQITTKLKRPLFLSHLSHLLDMIFLVDSQLLDIYSIIAIIYKISTLEKKIALNFLISIIRRESSTFF